MSVDIVATVSVVKHKFEKSRRVSALPLFNLETS